LRSASTNYATHFYREVIEGEIIMSLVRDYIEICKPRVVMLMILTSLVGMCLAPASGHLWVPLILGNLGIALVAGAAAALNHVADQHYDKLMRRTQYRPVAQGRISTRNSLIFAVTICLVGMGILTFCINTLTAVLTFLSLIGYAVFYTLYLKHATPQNIVIGGIAGAAPPLLGWTAVTGSISPAALLLVLIVYVWTPPHFWALAIYRLEDYAKANIPMLPHTHSVAYTKLNIVLYTILLVCVTTLPYLIHMSGLLYLVGATIANGFFLFYAIRLYRQDDRKYAIQTFWYSIYYLGIIFLLLLIDHAKNYF
jgi:protoheme IX farnesyltransferase